MTEYKLKGGKIIKDGHTMFLEDAVQDLKRGAFLEKQFNHYWRCGDCKKLVINDRYNCPYCE